MMFGLLIEESDSQLQVSIRSSDNLLTVLFWFDAFALEVVFHGGNGIASIRICLDRRVVVRQAFE
jgi:hypothetical protein